MTFNPYLPLDRQNVASDDLPEVLEEEDMSDSIDELLADAHWIKNSM